MSAPKQQVPFARPPEKIKNHWIWWVVFGCGMVSCVGFVIAAIQVRTRKFVIAAMVAVAANLGAFAVAMLDDSLGVTTDPNAETTTDAGWSFGVWAVVIVWAALGIYAAFLYGDFKKLVETDHAARYLQWNAARAQAYGLYTQPPVQQPLAATAPPPAPPPAPSPAETARDDVLEAEVDRYLAAEPAGNRPGPTPPNVPTS